MTRADAVAVTGMGVITPLGDSIAALRAALEAGTRAIEPSAEVPSSGEARLRDFDATRYANIRGMRVYNRTTQLGISAVKLALTDAGLDPAALDPLEFGVVTALTYGHMDTLIEYDRSLITLGVQRTNPSLMPLGIPNAPGSAIALSFLAKAFSITLADGGASGLTAIALGARLVASGRASVCVVVSAFSRCQELLVSAQRAGMLAPEGAFKVLDQNACGTAFGEVATALVLERSADASARGAAIKGGVLGHGAASRSNPSGSTARSRAPRTTRCKGPCRTLAARAARLGATGQPERDAAEARALATASRYGRKPALTAMKATSGIARRERRAASRSRRCPR